MAEVRSSVLVLQIALQHTDPRLRDIRCLLKQGRQRRSAPPVGAPERVFLVAASSLAFWAAEAAAAAAEAEVSGGRRTLHMMQKLVKFCVCSKNYMRSETVSVWG